MATIHCTFLVTLGCLTCLAFAQDNEFHLDQVYAMDADGTIELYSDDARIFITGTDRNDAHVKIDRKLETDGIVSGQKDFNVAVTTSAGNLTIRQHEEGNISVAGSIREEYTIEIEAPQGVSLHLRGDDDDYEIRHIQGAITIQNDDGDAELRGCGGEYFSFDFDDGDIRMDEGRGTLIVHLDDGNFEVRDGQFNAIEAKNDDGELRIETSLADEGQYSIETSDAAVELKITGGGGAFHIRHDDSSLDASNAFQRVEEDEHFTRLQLPSGNARVDIRTDDSQLRVSVL